MTMLLEMFDTTTKTSYRAPDSQWQFALALPVTAGAMSAVFNYIPLGLAAYDIVTIDINTIEAETMRVASVNTTTNTITFHHAFIYNHARSDKAVHVALGIVPITFYGVRRSLALSQADRANNTIGMQRCLDDMVLKEVYKSIGPGGVYFFDGEIDFPTNTNHVGVGPGATKYVASDDFDLGGLASLETSLFATKNTGPRARFSNLPQNARIYLDDIQFDGNGVTNPICLSGQQPSKCGNIRADNGIDYGVALVASQQIDIAEIMAIRCKVGARFHGQQFARIGHINVEQSGYLNGVGATGVHHIRFSTQVGGNPNASNDIGKIHFEHIVDGTVNIVTGELNLIGGDYIQVDDNGWQDTRIESIHASAAAPCRILHVNETQDVQGTYVIEGMVTQGAPTSQILVEDENTEHVVYADDGAELHDGKRRFGRINRDNFETNYATLGDMRFGLNGDFWRLAMHTLATRGKAWLRHVTGIGFHDETEDGTNYKGDALSGDNTDFTATTGRIGNWLISSVQTRAGLLWKILGGSGDATPVAENARHDWPGMRMEMEHRGGAFELDNTNPHCRKPLIDSTALGDNPVHRANYDGVTSGGGALLARTRNVLATALNYAFKAEGTGEARAAIIDGLLQLKRHEIVEGDFNYQMPNQSCIIDVYGIPSGGGTITMPSGNIRNCVFIIIDSSGLAGTRTLTFYTGGPAINGGAATITIDTPYSGLLITINSIGGVNVVRLGKSHTQHTDTGTTSATWDLDSDGTTAAVRLKALGAARLALRNISDTAYADLEVGEAEINGPLVRPPRVMTATGTIAATDGAIVADAAGGNITVTLPAAVDGKMVPIVAIDATNIVTVSRAGTDTIQGGLTSFGMPVASVTTLYAYSGVWYYV